MKILSTIDLHNNISKTSHYPHHRHLREDIATAIPTWVMDQHISLYTRVMKILDDIGSYVSQHGRKIKLQLKIDRWKNSPIP